MVSLVPFIQRRRFRVYKLFSEYWRIKKLINIRTYHIVKVWNCFSDVKWVFWCTISGNRNIPSWAGCLFFILASSKRVNHHHIVLPTSVWRPAALHLSFAVIHFQSTHVPLTPLLANCLLWSASRRVSRCPLTSFSSFFEQSHLMATPVASHSWRDQYRSMASSDTPENTVRSARHWSLNNHFSSLCFLCFVY